MDLLSDQSIQLVALGFLGAFVAHRWLEPFMTKRGGIEQRGVGVDFVLMDSRIKELHEALLEVKKK